MKAIKLFLFLFAIVFVCEHTRAQEAKPYKPAETFQEDTARYLEYNFTTRNAQYIGKTVGEALKDLEYPILYVSPIYQNGIESDPPTRLAGLCFVVRQVGNEPSDSELKGYYIRIFFENPPTRDEYTEVSGLNRDNRFPIFSQKLYDFVKDLKVKHIGSNPYIIRDPEILKRAQQRQKEDEEKGRRAHEEWLKLRKANKLDD